MLGDFANITIELCYSIPALVLTNGPISQVSMVLWACYYRWQSLLQFSGRDKRNGLRDRSRGFDNADCC